ncbi:MAG: ATP-grasp domain-containing protein [Verrucomicrobia bacterium]|nr:ATP-grasp domain-containing protein [Verrucomicrobiota bacterium]
MNVRSTRVGILYNAFVPRLGRPKETLSARALETAARQAGAALAADGYRIQWIPVRDRIEEIVAPIRRRRPAVIVNLCEGFRGHSAYEAQVAGLLELLDIPFTGNSSHALFQCHDKFRTNAILKASALPTPPGWLVEDERQLPAAARFPLIVKPNCEDASIGIYPHSVVRTRMALRKQVARVLAAYDQPALVESFVDGREINAAIVEESEPRVLPLSEILFQHYPAGLPRIVGYDAKWQAAHPTYRGTVPVCPARVSPTLAQRLTRFALQAYRVLKLRGYARVDFRLDARSRAYILDVNPNPDTSREAGLARSLAAEGIAYEDFWRSQVRLALKKK